MVITPLKPSKEDDGEEEMPVLFMEGLPSDFKNNVDLAAIATFMQGDESEPEENEAKCDKTRSYSQKRRKRHGIKHKRSKPYDKNAVLYHNQAKSTKEKDENCKAVDGNSSTGSNRSQTKAHDTSTKELQLYLSLFKV
jgi:hypothetical protein